jgi:hypothetical protein
MKNNIVYWRKKNGDLISVDDMDENHLRNTLKMIIRNNNKKQEFKLNGDAANDFNDTYPEDEYQDYACDIINEF